MNVADGIEYNKNCRHSTVIIIGRFLLIENSALENIKMWKLNFVCINWIWISIIKNI